MNIELGVQEQKILLDVLREELGTVREEIYHSDTSSFKDVLKEKEKWMRSILSKLGGPQD